jgi:hypothetical protein
MTEDRVFVLTYGESPAYHIRTVEELDAELDRAHAQSANDEWGYLAMIHHYSGEEFPDRLHLGVGRAFSFLEFNAAYVAGDLDEGEKSWWWWSQVTDHGPGIGIPNEVAREAAREFVRTGERPTNVEWIEDEV